MTLFKDSSSLTIGVLNTSIASENGGDFIIMEAAAKEIGECLPLAFKIHLTTHEKLSRASLRLQGKVAFNIACGTNLLHSHMEIVKQWNIGFYAAWFLKPVVLLGVGWRGQARRRTTIYTKLLLRRLLSREHLHSVRDSYTETRLREIGVENVINTACPTMWSLMPEHCAEIPAEKGDDVVVTLTDYSRDAGQDRQLLDVLKRLVPQRILVAARRWRLRVPDVDRRRGRGTDPAVGPGGLRRVVERSHAFVGLRGHEAARRHSGLAAQAEEPDYRRGPPRFGEGPRLRPARRGTLHSRRRFGAGSPVRTGRAKSTFP